jgi:outer membrane protein assembly factor BamA
VTTRQRRRGARVDLCFVVEPGPRYLIAELAPVGNTLVPSRELVALVDDHDGKANRAGAPFRPDLLEPARLLWLALYYDRGFLNVELGEPRVVGNETEDAAHRVAHPRRRRLPASRLASPVGCELRAALSRLLGSSQSR